VSWVIPALNFFGGLFAFLMVVVAAIIVDSPAYEIMPLPPEWQAMQITHIEIHAGDVDRPYRTIGAISAKVQAATAFSQTPTIEDVNLKLQEQASRMGANAVIQVQYDRGMSLISYKVLKARGIAVVLESDDVRCPYCAELIKRAAVKCKHCGSDLAQKQAG
jgi:hypothetical protein